MINGILYKATHVCYQLYRENREKSTFMKIREIFTALPSLKNATASGTVKSKYYPESSVSEVQTDRQIESTSLI